MATPFPANRANREDDVWAWLEPQIHQHGRQLYRFALSVLGNREDAEDATQIVVLNAYRALVRGERPTWPRAWLFAIALNVCRRLRRQASARHALVASTRELLSLEPGSDAPTGTEILHALSSLPSRQRKIFLLRELRGLSYAELSERLDLCPAAAESLLARARRRLREELAPSDESSDRRSPRRRPLISLPGASVALRLVRRRRRSSSPGSPGLPARRRLHPRSWSDCTASRSACSHLSCKQPPLRSSSRFSGPFRVPPCACRRRRSHRRHGRLGALHLGRCRPARAPWVLGGAPVPPRIRKRERERPGS